MLNTAVPAGQTPVEKARTAAMVEAAKVLPEEAAEKVAANAMEDVDAVTAKVVDSGTSEASVTTSAAHEVR
ncbi:hypothetical protein K4749_01895 [Streptomyces sp. TRM72054]|uniref:hypothetical protein n=1 Tax=Streptomyces sp. TRM72054 TaxID=2870562 RepID=UPI001C8CCB74|nr:hypothetical protein [Streptomyces sp. TRM72054]MBX9392380.1 hypothetical protein [Streptomyces sp. TRM72054]